MDPNARSNDALCSGVRSFCQMEVKLFKWRIEPATLGEGLLDIEVSGCCEGAGFQS